MTMPQRVHLHSHTPVPTRAGQGILGLSGPERLAVSAGLPGGRSTGEGPGPAAENLNLTRAHREKDMEKTSREQILRAFVETQSAEMTPAQRAVLSALPPERAAEVLARQIFANDHAGTGEQVLPSVEARSDAPTSLRAFRAARKGGFTGSYMDFLRAKRENGITGTDPEVPTTASPQTGKDSPWHHLGNGVKIREKK